MTRRDEILEYLATDELPWTPIMLLAIHLGLRHATVAGYLRQLQRDGLVRMWQGKARLS